MKRKSVFAIVILIALILESCSTTKLSEEEQSRLIEGNVFSQADNATQIEYVPVEVVRYVYPEENKVVEERNTEQTVEDTIENSVVSADKDADFLNAITEYSFTDGKIYEVFTAPGHVTDVRLAAGETISGDAAIGDSNQWQMTTAVSSENGRSVTHIYIKPVMAGLETTMIIPTDQRTYYVRLKSFDTLHMLGVRWNYPYITTFSSPNASIDTGIDLDISSLDFEYSIKGDKPFWRPVAVFDDGIRTYFQFDPRFSTYAGAPSLYFLPKQSQGESKAEIVNYVIKGNLYIADSVLQDKQAWVLLTEKDTVKITKR